MHSPFHGALATTTSTFAAGPDIESAPASPARPCVSTNGGVDLLHRGHRAKPWSARARGGQ
ncbi:MAG TPA: hypothetical protein VF457_08545 [Burkholderiaceae bacterium]